VDNQLKFEPGTAFDSLPNGESTEVTVSYTMSDDAGVESTSTVTITVMGTNEVPVISASLEASVNEDNTLILTQEELLVNAT
jgi:VCBS repeat-containing protein